MSALSRTVPDRSDACVLARCPEEPTGHLAGTDALVCDLHTAAVERASSSYFVEPIRAHQGPELSREA